MSSVASTALADTSLPIAIQTATEAADVTASRGQIRAKRRHRKTLAGTRRPS